MRRMRDFTFGHYVAAAVPVAAAIIGIRYLTNHSHSGASGKESASLVKPSQFKASEDSDSDRSAHHDRKIASAGQKRDKAQADEEDAETDVDVVETAEEASAQPVTDHRPSLALQAALNDVASVGTDCAQVEFRGEGPQATKVTKGEWTTVMDQFHAAKHELLGWLDKHHSELPVGAVEAMQRQVRDLKIQRPPASEEPDLSWRGIGVYTQNAEGEPIIKLGGGFVRMAVSHPARAKFEMARLVAQSWAPCELQRLTAQESTWTPLLRCLGVAENQGCGQGSYSESGWAVSTTLAANVSPPGCQIPAFKQPELAKCMSFASHDRAPASAEGGHK